MSGARRAGVAAGLAATLVAGVVLAAAVVSERDRQPLEPRLPATPAPAFTIPPPRLLASAAGAHLSRWAALRSRAVARRLPALDAPAVMELSTRTPEGTSNIVLVLDSTTDEEGRLWVEVRLPMLPNGTTGWVSRRQLGGYTLVRTRLEVDLGRLTARLFRDGREIFRAPVGVGEPRWPTPTGRFYIRDRLTRYRSAFYGPVSFGTSARSTILTDWPAGGFIGIHGTSRPELLPGRVSHGCIRLRNEDIVELDRLMPVGTPLTITA